jgi:hypothetical protein
VYRLLTSHHMAERPTDLKRGHRAIDGGVVSALNKVGRYEYVHSPSLVQHTGKVSAIGNREHPTADSFRGEDYDALELLATSTTVQRGSVSTELRRKRGR